MWETLLRSHWSLGTEPLQLVVESIQVNPAIALCRIFHDARVFIHSDGLMSYGPSRNPVEPAITQRLEGIVYPDLVPGLVPLLLSEAEARLLPMDPTHLASVFEDLARGSTAAKSTPWPGLPRCVLVLGQYLSNLGLIEETANPPARADARRGQGDWADTVVFKPHPAAPPAPRCAWPRRRGLGLRFEVCESALSAERWP